MDDFLEIVSAVNNQTRVVILSFLLKNGRSCVCELEYSLHIAQARLSTNLNILKKAGYIDVQREGKWAYYKINPKKTLHNKILREIQILNLDIPKKVNKSDIQEIVLKRY